MTDDIRDGGTHNPEGYADYTAFNAMKHIEADEADARAERLIRAINTIIDLAGFEKLNRIEVRDRKSGRTYR